MTHALKIGFDAKRAFQNAAGLGNHSRNTILGLTKYFPDNTYFLYSPKKETDLFSAPAHAAVIYPESMWWNSVKPLWRRYKITELAQKNGLDIYHGLSHELPMGIEKTGIKSVVTIHDLIFMRYPELYKTADRRFYFRKYLHACRVADKIIAISEQTKQDLMTHFHIADERIEVVYQSINPIFYHRNRLEELETTRQKYQLPDEFILAPGTIEARKNLGNTLQALINGTIETPLVVVGKTTKYIAKIQPLIKRLGKQVIFLHKVTDQELSHLYQMAGLTIYPSIFEGFGLPVAEAQACGCPVITSNISSMPEAGGNAAYYVDPLNPAEIADGITEILGDKSLKAKMIQDGHKNTERFQTKKYANSLMTIYQNLHHA